MSDFHLLTGSVRLQVHCWWVSTLQLAYWEAFPVRLRVIWNFGSLCLQSRRFVEPFWFSDGGALAQWHVFVMLVVMCAF